MGEFITVTYNAAQDALPAGSVATVCLNRAALHNAFNPQMIQELRTAFVQFHKSSPVRAVVLSAEGKSFCAGADLNWMQAMVKYTFEQNVEDAHALAGMLKAINDCPKPVIARVHGATFGGGIGLVAACDMAFALESTIFCLSEVKLGLIPAVISPFVLKKIGPAQAHRYFLTAEKFNAQEAKRLGLVADVLADEAALDQQIQSVLAAIVQNGPEAVTQSKVLIAQMCQMSWDRAIDITTKMIAERRISQEGQEGMMAFLDKRPPNWVAFPAKPLRS